MASLPVTTTDHHVPTISPEAERFSLMQRQARMFAMSPLIPEALRKGAPEQAMANCYIAMSIADRMGEDRMTVMQNIHIIHGTAGFKSSYMIARANASGKFKDEIEWEESGEGPTLSLTAFATLAKSGRRVEMTVDMAMAKAEGWTSNKKYTTMPKVMLRYRSAAFLIRLYAPEVMLGHQTAEEIEDVRYAHGPDLNVQPLSAAMLVDQSKPAEDVAQVEPAELDAEARAKAQEWADAHLDAIDAAATEEDLADVEQAGAGAVAKLKAGHPDLHFEVTRAYEVRRAALTAGGPADDQRGDQFPDGDAD